MKSTIKPTVDFEDNNKSAIEVRLISNSTDVGDCILNDLLRNTDSLKVSGSKYYTDENGDSVQVFLLTK